MIISRMPRMIVMVMVKGRKESLFMLIPRYTVAFAPEKHVLTNDHGLVVIR